MRRLKITFAVLVTFLLIYSCNPDSEINCEEHQVADCGEDLSKTNIRIENISDFDFCNVVLDPGNKSTNYGFIERRATTCYRSFEIAYDYAYVKLFIGEKEFTIQPFDYFGEQPLGEGKFTYSIDVKDFDKGELSIQATTD